MAGFVIEGTKSLETLVTTILSYARPVQIQPQSIELGAFLKQLGKFVRVDPAYPVQRQNRNPYSPGSDPGSRRPRSAQIMPVQPDLQCLSGDGAGRLIDH